MLAKTLFIIFVSVIIQVSHNLPAMCSYLVEYARSLFEALDCLHKKYQIIHGDIKPSNTRFYRENNSSPFVFKLLDFGLSRCFGATHNPLLRCNTGTLSFNSPECAAEIGCIHPGLYLHTFTNSLTVTHTSHS